MNDPKKMAALAIEALPPPDRLKRKPMAAEGDEPDDAEGDSGDRAGIMAMEDFEKAATPAEKFAALKRAVAACDSGDDYED